MKFADVVAECERLYVLKIVYGRIENMEYAPQHDIYICRNGKKLTIEHIRNSKSKTGYVKKTI